jgi:hypothetical protein
MTALPARKAPLALKTKNKSVFLIFCDACVAQAQKLRYLSRVEVNPPRKFDYFI